MPGTLLRNYFFKRFGNVSSCSSHVSQITKTRQRIELLFFTLTWHRLFFKDFFCRFNYFFIFNLTTLFWGCVAMQNPSHFTPQSLGAGGRGGIHLLFAKKSSSPSMLMFCGSAHQIWTLLSCSFLVSVFFFFFGGVTFAFVTHFYINTVPMDVWNSWTLSSSFTRNKTNVMLQVCAISCCIGND